MNKQKAHIYTRFCDVCKEFKPNMAYYGSVCPDCRKPTGGKRAWLKGENTPIKRMEALGVL